MMKATAQKYDRSLELNLESMELSEIMEKLGTGKCPAWQTEAYLGHVMDTTCEENLLKLLSQQENVTVLMDNSAFLVRHTRKLLEIIFSNSQSDFSGLLSLIRKVFDDMSLEELSELHQTFHGNYGLENLLRSDSWDEKFVLTLNKFSLGAENEKSTNKDILMLSLEDGPGFLDSLLCRAATDGGKVKTCAEILMAVSSLCKIKVPTEGSFILANKILQMLFDRNHMDENRRKNVFNLLLILGATEPEFCLQVIPRISGHIFSQIRIEGVTNETLAYTDLISDMIKMDQILTQLNKELEFGLGVPFALELNAMSNLFAPSDCQLKFKELAIDILRPLIASHQELTNILRPDNLCYFEPSRDKCESLRQKLSRTCSTNMKNGEDDGSVSEVSGSDQDYGQMIGLVPTLMPAEWGPVCKTDLDPHILIQTVTQLILLQELDSPVKYRVLRSLCSELPASWTNFHQMIRYETFVSIQEKMKYFYLRMLHVITHDDLKQLLWSSIFANLSKLLQDLDNDKIKESLELLLALDHQKENVLTAIELIMNARNKSS